MIYTHTYMYNPLRQTNVAIENPPLLGVPIETFMSRWLGHVPLPCVLTRG